ncbi:hypothetical protein GCM10009654_25040 [Streptomyces hebeiensis]|uniref:SH3 domain-containing protein n=2 Tax=Streptomyces hebeiensis TaxID=229486 RepID=A0ABN1UTD9_9ACTN
MKRMVKHTSKNSGGNRTKAWAVAALPVASVAALLGTAPAASAVSAGASACTSNYFWSNKDSDTGRAVRAVVAPIREVPASCGDKVAAVDSSTKLQYHCYITNSSGNRWTHVRVDGLSTNGWVYSPNLDDGGSTKKC